ncbi:hypothetical protein ACFFLM_04400 [Deinococcus oregonensis]|uniref:Minor tail protein n=1 Tax=Deinococcus oregonensis TaxID=1805970 RepID=A0ABV6AYH7_9DEIO
MAPWETRPGLGRYGAILIAAQTAVGSVASAPTHTLKATQFMAPLEQLIRTKDEGANGSVRNRRSRVQGVVSDGRQVTVEMTLSALAELMKAFGPVTTNVVTPSNSNFGALAPGVPFTVWQLHPTGDRIASDVQIGAVVLTVGARANVTAQITFNITTTAALTGTAPIPVNPIDQLQFKHFWLKIGATTYKPETGTVNLTVPMSVVDGANGTDPTKADYPIGWERSDSAMLMFGFTLSELVPALRTAYEQNTLLAIEAGFTLPGTTPKTIKWTIATAEIGSVNVSQGTDRITVPYEATGVSDDTLAEFTITLPAA